MIKETRKKIHFLAHTPKRGRKKDDSAPPTISVFPNRSMILFSRGTIDELGMAGKFVRFYYDPVQKIIGWKIESEMSQAEMKNWKVCRVHKTGMWQVSVRQLLNELSGRKSLAPAYKKLPVQKYREVGIMTKPNDVYYFVELKNQSDV